MKKCRIKFLVIIILFICFQTVQSQQFMTADEFEKFLDRAELQSQNYTKVFRNLSAEELKTKIFYKADGTVDEKRVTKSLFLVYQSPTTNFAQEFRSVLEYNGKNVQRSEKETVEFFEKLAEKTTSQEEYVKLRKESLRFDGPKNPWGITLSQTRPFMKDLRANFKFRVIGKEKIERRDVWVIEYEQIKYSPHILSNPTAEEIKEKQWAIQYNTPMSDSFQPTNPLIKGKIWLDAETAQMWKNDFKVYLNPKVLSKAVVNEELIYEYQSSKFGILVPKRFWFLPYIIKGKNGENLTVRKDIEFVFEYSNFSEFKSETKDYRIDGEVKN